MNILGIDSGTTHSGLVIWDSEQNRVRGYDICPNGEVWDAALEIWKPDRIVYEMIASYGMPVGRETFETCVWIGRFYEGFNECVPAMQCEQAMIYRKEVCLHLCQSPRAKDSNIRQALLDRFPASGGGKTPQIGTKALPGPLYGFKSHLWSALAVAIAGHEMWDELERFPE